MTKTVPRGNATSEEKVELHVFDLLAQLLQALLLQLPLFW